MSTRHPTIYRRALIVLALLAVAVPAFSLGAGTAQAAQEDWSCTMAPTTWCILPVGHYYDINQASRPAPWNMCQKLYAPNSNPEYQYSIGCSQGPVYAVGGYSSDLGRAPYPNNNTVMIAGIANNNSQNWATVYGTSVY